MHHQQHGSYSFASGFAPNAKQRKLDNAHADLLVRARANPEHCFDQLCEQGRTQEALWLIEHLDQITTNLH